MDMLNAVKSVLADVSRVSPSLEQEVKGGRRKGGREGEGGKK